jgi:REP element-mobilizing transposase RayT
VVQVVKSVVAREVFLHAPEVKQKLWGCAFWGEGYFVNTVGQHGIEKVIAAYVQGQGGKSEYRTLHRGQLDLVVP